MVAQVHLINPLSDAAGGSEWRTLCLYEVLSKHGQVSIWSEGEADPDLASRYPIKRIAGSEFPRDGTLVFVGVYFPIGFWVQEARPRRIVLVCTTNSLDRLKRLRERFMKRGIRRIEQVFATRALKGQAQLEGELQPSWIDITRFASCDRPGDRFVVGRHSRDVPEKHHAGAAGLYRRLAAAGCTIRIMGGRCLEVALSEAGAIELLPACAEDAAYFLRRLDCFVYRTSETMVEAYGRAVAEAMATGLPVVCHKSGGYAEYIEHGVDGLLFDRDEEAEQMVLGLRNDPTWRRRLGAAARTRMEGIYSPACLRRLLDFYLQEG